jgi:hypothetical protein
MSRKGARQLVFVCASIVDNELITKIIPATSQSEAAELYSKEYGHSPKDILGPFIKKKTQVIEVTRVLKFTSQTKKAIYGDWIVTAFILTDPPDQAYLVFNKRVDDKKAPSPKGTITAPISDLRFL